MERETAECDIWKVQDAIWKGILQDVIYGEGNLGCEQRETHRHDT